MTRVSTTARRATSRSTDSKWLSNSSCVPLLALAVSLPATVLTHLRAAQNGGQGLGFKVPILGVMDKKALMALAAKLYVVLGTLITALLAMAEDVALSGDGVCTLTAVQTSTIQSVMTGSNASCFNRTLNSIMN